jgi:hypothetical protein
VLKKYHHGTPWHDHSLPPYEGQQQVGINWVWKSCGSIAERPLEIADSLVGPGSSVAHRVRVYRARMPVQPTSEVPVRKDEYHQRWKHTNGGPWQAEHAVLRMEQLDDGSAG